jgi:hypothetical protein
MQEPRVDHLRAVQHSEIVALDTTLATNPDVERRSVRIHDVRATVELGLEVHIFG